MQYFCLTQFVRSDDGALSGTSLRSADMVHTHTPWGATMLSLPHAFRHLMLGQEGYYICLWQWHFGDLGIVNQWAGDYQY